MNNQINQRGVSRRKFLQVSGAGVVTATAVGSGLLSTTSAIAEPYSGTHTWISPRGTIEVMDDYAIWVAQEMGYFGDLGVDVKLEPAPLVVPPLFNLCPLDKLTWASLHRAFLETPLKPKWDWYRFSAQAILIYSILPSVREKA